MSRRSLHHAKINSEVQELKVGSTNRTVLIVVPNPNRWSANHSAQKPRRQQPFSTRNPRRKSVTEFKWTMRHAPCGVLRNKARTRADAVRSIAEVQEERRMGFAPGTIGAVIRDVQAGT